LAIVAILGAVLIVAVGYLVFRFGWHKVKVITTDGVERNSFGVGPLEQQDIERSVGNKLMGRF